jgi:uracil DNA glycosylase
VGYYNSIEYSLGEITGLSYSYPSGINTPPMISTILSSLDDTILTREKINLTQWGFKIAGEISS